MVAHLTIFHGGHSLILGFISTAMVGRGTVIEIQSCSCLLVKVLDAVNHWELENWVGWIEENSGNSLFSVQ